MVDQQMTPDEEYGVIDWAEWAQEQLGCYREHIGADLKIGLLEMQVLCMMAEANSSDPVETINRLCDLIERDRPRTGPLPEMPPVRRIPEQFWDVEDGPVIFVIQF